MKKIIIVGFAVLAVSASPALAKGKGKAMKPKTDAVATNAGSGGPFMNTGGQGPFMGQVSAADREMYKKNMHDSGMKK